MTVQEFEQAVWQVEGIRVVVRAAPSAEVGSYPYRNAAIKSNSVTQWLESRIAPQLENYGVQVVDGYGVRPHGGTSLRKIRASYGA